MLRVRRFRTSAEWLLALPALLASLWLREYHNAKIILEQKGDIRHFSVSGHLQRNIARSLILLGAASAVIMTLLIGFSVFLLIGNAKLERSHNEIYTALLGSSVVLTDTSAQSMSKDDMLVLVQTIRERDIEIRRFVKSSATASSADGGFKHKAQR